MRKHTLLVYGLRNLKTTAIEVSVLETLDQQDSSSFPEPIVVTLIQVYLEQSRMAMARIHRAVGSNDRSWIHREAHSLKTSSRIVGAFSLAEMFRQLESSCLGELALQSELADAVKDIDVEMSRVWVELNMVLQLCRGELISPKFRQRWDHPFISETTAKKR